MPHCSWEQTLHFTKQVLTDLHSRVRNSEDPPQKASSQADIHCGRRNVKTSNHGSDKGRVESVEQERNTAVGDWGSHNTRVGLHRKYSHLYRSSNLLHQKSYGDLPWELNIGGASPKPRDIHRIDRHKGKGSTAAKREIHNGGKARHRRSKAGADAGDKNISIGGHRTQGKTGEKHQRGTVNTHPADNQRPSLRHKRERQTAVCTQKIAKSRELNSQITIPMYIPELKRRSTQQIEKQRNFFIKTAKREVENQNLATADRSGVWRSGEKVLRRTANSLKNRPEETKKLSRRTANEEENRRKETQMSK